MQDAGFHSATSADVGYTLSVSGNLAVTAKPGAYVFDLLDPNTACIAN